MKAILFARIFAIYILLALITAGCTSSRSAKLKQQEAYIAGQQQAMAEAQLAKTPSVTVQGNVLNQIIPWTEDLTVAKAIVAAQYQGITNPRTIRLVRNRVAIDIKASDLLKGQDVPVISGDTIIILY